MLPKVYRLPAKEKLEKSSVSNEYFRILTKPNNLEYNRFGFVISKKIDKRAVSRNRMKRILSEAVREFIKTEHGKDALFIVKKSFVGVRSKEIYGMVREQLVKI